MHAWDLSLWFTLLLMKSAPAKIRKHVAAYLIALLVVAALVTGDQLAKPTIVYAAPDTVAAPAVLKVEGAVPAPLSLTAEDLAKMPRTTAQLAADGTTTTYEGVLLYDILVKAGWQFGRGMTGKPMASYLLATGKDGYQVVFALPELDPQFSGAKVMIADKADGSPLPAREQPFRIVAPEDKMHARSIYSLVKLEVVRLRP
jgi:DMSO/TMAO reductase YedYZ molybdopterin-dependent catalytic subunit